MIPVQREQHKKSQITCHDVGESVFISHAKTIKDWMQRERTSKIL